MSSESPEVQVEETVEEVQKTEPEAQAQPAKPKSAKKKKGKKGPAAEVKPSNSMLDKVLPPRARKAICDTAEKVVNGVSAVTGITGKWLWYGGATVVVLVLPLAIQIQREHSLAYASHALRSGAQ